MLRVRGDVLTGTCTETRRKNFQSQMMIKNRPCCDELVTIKTVMSISAHTHFSFSFFPLPPCSVTLAPRPVSRSLPPVTIGTERQLIGDTRNTTGIPSTMTVRRKRRQIQTRLTFGTLPARRRHRPIRFWSRFKMYALLAIAKNGTNRTRRNECKPCFAP